jgi:hypothetical protein
LEVPLEAPLVDPPQLVVPHQPVPQPVDQLVAPSPLEVVHQPVPLLVVLLLPPLVVLLLPPLVAQEVLVSPSLEVPQALTQLQALHTHLDLLQVQLVSQDTFQSEVVEFLSEHPQTDQPLLMQELLPKLICLVVVPLLRNSVSKLLKTVPQSKLPMLCHSVVLDPLVVLLSL